MALNAFLKIGKAEGEAKQGKYGTEKWLEIQSWEWEVEAETSWTKGGGASVGKPNPGKVSWEHYWDTSSHLILGYICCGAAFSNVTVEICKTTGATLPEPYLIVTMSEVFITKVTNVVSEEGNVTQKVEMVFKEIAIDYKPQGLNLKNPGALGAPKTFKWNVQAGNASPSTGA